MNEELKPCPFCGGEGNVIERINPMSKWRWSVDCASTTCGMSGPVEANKAGAIIAWNTRTTDARITSLEEENARLREALDFYAKDHPWPNDGPWGAESSDFGKVARAALSIRGEG